MDDWGRNRGGYRNSYSYQSKSYGRSQYRKPQQHDYWKPPVPQWVNSVPSWERMFISDIGNITWGRFVHCQKSLELYSDVLEWDDSEGKVAFSNAKHRYWAAVNRQPCDIPLPDPCMYIDEIDWNAETDPELYKDLDNISVIVPNVEEKDAKAGFVNNTPHYMDQPVVATGWGDEEPNWQGGGNKVTGKDDPSWGAQGPSWVMNSLSSLMKPIIPSGRGDGEDDPRKTSCYQSQDTSLQSGGKTADGNYVSLEGNPGGWGGASWGANNCSLQDHDNKANDRYYWEGSNGGWGGAPCGSHYPSLQDGNKKVNDWEGNNGDRVGAQWGSHYTSLQDGDKKADDKKSSWEGNNGGWGGRSMGWHNKATDNNSWEHKIGGWEGRSTGWHDKAFDRNNSWEAKDGGCEAPLREEGGWGGGAWGSNDKANNKNYPQEGKQASREGTPCGLHDKTGDKNSSWEHNNGGWQGAPGHSSSLVKNTPSASGNTGYYRNSGSWRKGGENWRKRESESQQLSRYKTTRYQAEDYQADHGWRNNSGKKRVSFANEQSPMEPLASRQWNPIHTCGPVSHHKPGKAGNSWSWEKQIS